MGFVLGLHWVGLRLAAGVVLVFGVAYVVQWLVHPEPLPGDAGLPTDQVAEAHGPGGSDWTRWPGGPGERARGPPPGIRRPGSSTRRCPRLVLPGRGLERDWLPVDARPGARRNALRHSDGGWRLGSERAIRGCCAGGETRGGGPSVRAGCRLPSAGGRL